MKTISIVAPLLIVLVIGCNNSSSKAEKILEAARQKFASKEFNSAKLLIDSLRKEHPTSIEFTVKAEDLMMQINRSEQTHSLAFLEDLLQQKEQELKPLMQNFTEQLEVGDIPVLVHRRQKTENSYNRSYIQTYVNKAGEFYLVSRYTGRFPIQHEQIKVYNGPKEVYSEVIEAGDFYNRTFEADETWWETIQYKNGKDNGIADFVSANYQEPLKIEFIGKKRHYIVMEAFDKEAIRDGYEISFVLKEIAKIKEQIINIQMELNKKK